MESSSAFAVNVEDSSCSDSAFNAPFNVMNSVVDESQESFFDCNEEISDDENGETSDVDFDTLDGQHLFYDKFQQQLFHGRACNMGPLNIEFRM